jgi:hypothetical protein
MKQILFKLTDENGQTRGGTQWGPGATHSGTGKGGLFGPGYIHAYEHALLAVLLMPLHTNFRNPRLWEAEGEIALRDGQLKCGCVSLTTLREIHLPVVTEEQYARFAILCAKKVCENKEWNAWADGWLCGKDRSAESAAAAAWSAAAAWAAESAESAAANAELAANAAAAAGYGVSLGRGNYAANAAANAAAAARSAAELDLML